ncbi:MAG: OmpA family protein, partial [Cyanobacteria bacterium P01_C01_bin.38]
NKKEGVYHLYFNLLNAKKLKEVKGRVKVIDAERSKQLLVAKSHEIVNIKNPNNGSNRIKVASDIFGFKDVQYTLDLDNPVTDSTSAYVETIGDSIIVNFMLDRYRKGDVLVMYNVYFYRDAAIMKSESIYELNSLLDMLQENENYKVKIHGHTNGNSQGKIIHLDPEDKNFFSLKANHLETNGSAKKLSLYRAYSIQHWLIDQGIAEERMEIKGWGGKRMLYDKHDTQADQNVRVEIEILEE